MGKPAITLISLELALSILDESNTHMRIANWYEQALADPLHGYETRPFLNLASVEVSGKTKKTRTDGF